MFLVLLRAFKFQMGWVQPQLAMEKLRFRQDLMELHELPSFNKAKIRPQNKPKSNAKRQKKNKKHF
jgi:hypothetical protein